MSVRETAAVNQSLDARKTGFVLLDELIATGKKQRARDYFSKMKGMTADDVINTSQAFFDHAIASPRHLTPIKQTDLRRSVKVKP
jgi:hypothetical protein